MSIKPKRGKIIKIDEEKDKIIVKIGRKERICNYPYSITTELRKGGIVGVWRNEIMIYHGFF